MMRKPLHAVADSQDGDPQCEDIYIALGSLGIVNGARPTGKNDAGGFELTDFVERGGARQNGGEDLLFADAAGDELGVLAAEVENDYAAQLGVRALVVFLLQLGSAGHCPPVLSITKARSRIRRHRVRPKLS